MTSAEQSRVAAMADLPEGWAITTLENACVKITDGTHKTPNYQEKGVPFISTANLVPFRQGFDFAEYSRFISQREHDELTKRCRPEKGDILISKCGTIGRSKEVDVAYEFSIFVGLALLKPQKELFVPYFPEVLLNAPDLQTKFQELSPGSTRRTLTLAAIKTVEIPVPPLAEQGRIVEKVGSLLARVNAARERLARVPAILKRFRQAVLSAACSGDLTENYRTTVYNSETRAEERHQSYVDGELPTKWRFANVRDIADVLGGKRTPKGAAYAEGKTAHPYVRVTDFDGMTVSTLGLKYITENTYQQIQRYTISAKDVYISIAGSIGKVGLVPQELDGANLTENAAKLTKLRGVTKQFLSLALNAPAAQNQIEEFITSSGQPKLALFRIEKIVIPLPPLPEQSEIAHCVEVLFKLADAIEHRVAAATAQAEKLTEAILAKAFRGELVPTEAELARREGRSYEPASALLARIRARREGQAKSTRASQSRRK